MLNYTQYMHSRDGRNVMKSTCQWRHQSVKPEMKEINTTAICSIVEMAMLQTARRQRNKPNFNSRLSHQRRFAALSSNMTVCAQCY